MRWLGTILERLRRPTRHAPAPAPNAPGPSPTGGAETAEDRLTRLADWCLDGRAAAAELELHDWHRHEDCPPRARVLLAALLARRGRTEHALAAVAPAAYANAQLDPEPALLHVALLLAADLPDTARRAALSLYHHHGHLASVRAWLATIQPPGFQELPVAPEATVEHLAAELVAQPQVIPALAAAQKLAPDSQHIYLLRRALGRAARDLLASPPSALPTCQALADLALLAQDPDDARRWAHRGLRLDPYAVSLALVLARVSDDPAVGPPAHQVLAHAADAFPEYPDLQAAAIRRAHQDGDENTARMRLQRWLERNPRQPAALTLAQELAA
jgi:hypothetical protein